MVGDPLILASILVLTAVSVWLLAGWLGQFRSRRALERQLGALSHPPVARGEAGRQIVRRREDPTAGWIDRVLRLTPTLRNTDRLLEQAGLPWDRTTLLRASLGLGAALGLIGLAASGAALPTFAAALLGMLLPRLYVLRRKAQRVRAFEEQFPDAIDLLGRSIRAGHGVTSGLRMVAEESQEPIASEFRRVFEELKYGLPFEETLIALTRRVDLVDLRVMVVAILVQREVGGNLTEILDKLSRLIRTRFTLRRQLQVHTAQGKLGGYVLTMLPVAVAALLALLDPSYLGLLIDDPAGRLVLTIALMLQVIGYLWIWRILRLQI